MDGVVKVTSTAFQGWPKAALRFFAGLEDDNSKAYFEANRDVYERSVRAPMEALMAELELEFGPGKIFRINRDLRFSPDKSPYKTHIGAWTGREGRGGYVQLSAEGLYTAAGRHHMEKAELSRFRDAVADDRGGAELPVIIAGLRSSGYEVGGDQLKVVPPGYPRDHPRAALLRHKGIGISRDFGVPAWLGSPEAKDRIVQVWRDAEVLANWFDAHVG